MLTEYFHIQLQSNTEILIPLEHTVGAITCDREQICPIPGISPTALGVLNHGGKLLWAIQLSDLLGINQSGKSLKLQYNLTLVILTAKISRTTVEQAERQVGCVVSALKGIVLLNPNQFKSVPTQSPIFGSFLSGMTQIDRSLVSVINVNAVFTALANLDTSLVSS